MEEALVDRVRLDGRDHRPETIAHSSREVTVERVVGAEDLNLFSMDQGAKFELGVAHLDPKRLGLVRTGDGAAVVIREHDDRNALQIGAKDAFAGDIEIVAVDESKNFGHVLTPSCESRVSRLRRRAGLLLQRHEGADSEDWRDRATRSQGRGAA